MGIFQQGESYQHIRKFREDSSPTNVTSASMEITYPCESGVTTVAMSNTAVGTYQALWDIPSSATYGEYTVEVTAITGTTVSKFVSSFYILPWNITQQVRSISGIKQNNDISDDDIAIISWNAYLEAKEDCFKYIYNEKMKCDGYHCVDGSNKVFYAKNMHLVSGHTVCDEVAIKGWYETTTGEVEDLTISITDAETGKLSIADKDDNALDGTYCKLWYAYRIQAETYREQIFKKAVTYLAAHEVVIRFNELDKATLADIQSNSPIVLANPNRMKNQYKKTIKKCKVFKVGGV